jgi:hypothetical protein
MPPDIRDDLEAFVALVKELRSSRFSHNVLAQDAVTLRTRGVFDDVEFVGVDDDEMRSFLLGCRLLIQNNDRVSLGNIWKACNDFADISERFPAINAQHWMLNDFLDQHAPVTADETGTSVTHREILTTFLYGSYAHLERTHAARLRRWQSSPATYHVLKLTFILVLKVLLQTAGAIADNVEISLRNERDAV